MWKRHYTNVVSDASGRSKNRQYWETIPLTPNPNSKLKDSEEWDSEITEYEVENVVMAMGNGKSTGDDCIPVEVYKKLLRNRNKTLTCHINQLFDGHIGTVLAAAQDDARREQVEKALTLAKAAAAHDSYAAAVLLAGYEKDKAAAAALLGDFRAVAAAGLRGCASTPLTADAARRALSLADAAIQRLAAQVNPKITLSVLAAKLG